MILSACNTIIATDNANKYRYEMFMDLCEAFDCVSLDSYTNITSLLSKGVPQGPFLGPFPVCLTRSVNDNMLYSLLKIQMCF